MRHLLDSGRSPPDDRVTTEQASAGSPPGLQCQCHGDISITHSTAMKTLVLGDTSDYRRPVETRLIVNNGPDKPLIFTVKQFVILGINEVHLKDFSG